MSHSVVYVITKRKPHNPEDMERLVERALEPFNENIDVPEYERPCHCVGRKAQDDVYNQIDIEFGDREARSKAFDDRHPEFKGKGPFDEEVEEVWTREVVKPIEARSAELLAIHPGRETPDPTCGYYTQDFLDHYPDSAANHKAGDRYEDGSGCGGTGIDRTTYNPDSKWDWWTIGGRWSARFKEGYEPESDPRNWETCELCAGTGERLDGLSGERKCNGCGGMDRVVKPGEPPIGVKVKWPTQWVPVPEGDVIAVKDLLTRADFKELMPFSVLTPDGSWNEKGHMGWFGWVKDRKPAEQWHDEVRALLEAVVKEYPDAHAVNVDIHI